MSHSSLKILLSGSSGFIGSSLKVFLEEKGYCVVCLKRGNSENSSSSTIFWNPACQKWNSKDFEGFHAVIHLAGLGIADKRWTNPRKKELLSSRCLDTQLLSQILSELSSPPSTFICASAIGFYGSRGQEILTEQSRSGTGFLADLCRKWEAAAEIASHKPIRVIQARLGLVMGKNGGVLSKMLPLFRWGLGGRLGLGQQIVSWITLQDLMRAILFCLEMPALNGAVNFVSASPVSQQTFTSVLAQTLHRPAFFHIPAWLLRLLGGERVDELLLASQHVRPEKLLSAGFIFLHPDLNTAFSSVLK